LRGLREEHRPAMSAVREEHRPAMSAVREEHRPACQRWIHPALV
jgi:hypothetical protein